LRRARTKTKPSAPKAAKAIVPGSGTVIVNVLFIVAESPAVNVKLCVIPMVVAAAVVVPVEKFCESTATLPMPLADLL